MSFGETTWPTARKEHRCDLCYGPIPKGEKYSRWRGVFDGEWQDNAMHLECASSFSDEWQWEYISGEGDMPERIAKLVADRQTRSALALNGNMSNPANDKI